MLWDIFCKVIDNHGDIGVCWRAAAELAARGERIRLWVDDPSALGWMAPQGCAGVQVVHWKQAPPQVEPGDVVVEAFGCDPPPGFVGALAAKSAAQGRQPLWINLEYLSAEPYVERSHGLPSPVMDGPAKGLVKQFFYPGFSARTGGLLREQDLASRQATFDRDAWLAGLGVRAAAGTRLASLFCYEPAALPLLLDQLARSATRTLLLVTAGRAQRAVEAVLGARPADGHLAVHQLPLLSQRDYDHLLWSCDLNFVRGEDSVVRALWAGRPFVWHIYPQDDGAHEAKLDAFLDWLQAPSSLRHFHHVWNGLSAGPLPPPEMDAWGRTAELARTRALQLPELAAGLLRQATRAATI